MTLAMPPLDKFLGVMSGLSLGRLVSNLKSVALTVFELLAFNSHDRPLRTHKHTSNERIISDIHFVHLAEITRKCEVDCNTTAYRRSETDVAYSGATWQVCLKTNIGLLSSVPPLARWRDCVPIQVCPLLIKTLLEVDSWKTVHPSAKVTQERHICGMSTRGWKECRRRGTFPVTHRPVGWSQNRVP